MTAIAIEFRSASSDGLSSRTASVNFADLSDGVSLAVLFVGSLLCAWGACRVLRHLTRFAVFLLRIATGHRRIRRSDSREDGP